MRLKRLILALIVTLAGAALLSPVPALASGSYMARPPRPTDPAALGMDHSKYSLGRRLYLHHVRLPKAEAAPVEAQRKALAELDQLLPESARKRARLSEFAGRLTEEQLDALRYYITTRFKH